MNRPGLIALSDGVREYFQTNQIPAVVGKVGRHQRDLWRTEAPSGAGRVLFMQPPRTRGKLWRGQEASGFPRVILEWKRNVVLSVWGVDSDNPEDEEAQIFAVESLLEITLQAMRRAVDPVTSQALNFNNIEFGDIEEVDENRELYFGIELWVHFTLRGPLFDVEPTIRTPGVVLPRPTMLHSDTNS
jgi:hypothetical protein